MEMGKGTGDSSMLGRRESFPISLLSNTSVSNCQKPLRSYVLPLLVSNKKIHAMEYLATSSDFTD